MAKTPTLSLARPGQGRGVRGDVGALDEAVKMPVLGALSVVGRMGVIEDQHPGVGIIEVVGGIVLPLHEGFVAEQIHEDQTTGLIGLAHQVEKVRRRARHSPQLGVAQGLGTVNSGI